MFSSFWFARSERKIGQTLFLVCPVISVRTTDLIYTEHSRIPVCTSRHESVVWSVVL
jgi:hypothetical protein